MRPAAYSGGSLKNGKHPSNPVGMHTGIEDGMRLAEIGWQFLATHGKPTFMDIGEIPISQWSRWVTLRPTFIWGWIHGLIGSNNRDGTDNLKQCLPLNCWSVLCNQYHRASLHGSYSSTLQKVLADPKVLQRGLAATEVSITVYQTQLKMLPGQEDEKRSERAVLANPHSSLREITDESDMNYSIWKPTCAQVLVSYLYCRQAPQSTFGSARTSWSVWLHFQQALSVWGQFTPWIKKPASKAFVTTTWSHYLTITSFTY